MVKLIKNYNLTTRNGSEQETGANLQSILKVADKSVCATRKMLRILLPNANKPLH